MYCKPTWDVWYLPNMQKSIKTIVILILLFSSRLACAEDPMTEALRENQQGFKTLLENPHQLLIFFIPCAVILWVSRIFLRKIARQWLPSKSWQDWDCSLIYYLLFVILYLCLGMVIQKWMVQIQDPIQAALLAYPCINGIWCLIFLLWQSFRTDMTRNALVSKMSISTRLRPLGFCTFSWKQLMGSILGYVLFFPWYWFAYLLTMLSFAYFEIDPKSQSAVQNFLASEGMTRYAAIVTVVLIAPLTEEILFRGFLYGALRHALPQYPYTIMVVAAAIFACIHGSLVVLFPIFMLGLFLTWLYQRTQCLWLCILVHSLHNSLTLMYLIHRFGG